MGAVDMLLASGCTYNATAKQDCEGATTFGTLSSQVLL